MKCHSLELCSLVKITPPPQYRPITVTVKRKCPLFSIKNLILLTTCHTLLLMPVLRSWGLVKSEPVDDYFIYCRHSSVLQQPRSQALSLLASLVFERENEKEGAWNRGKFDNTLKFGSSTDLQFYTKGKRVKFLSDESIPSKCNQFY